VATIVIVHGACSGGWESRDVAARSRRDGHEVHTPTLTGLGERSHLLSPAIGLETHVLDIANVLRFDALRDVILVGHSYGGMVVMGAADRVPDRITRLVCIDGFVPFPGQSSRDLTPPDFWEEVLWGPAQTEGEGWRVPAWSDDDLDEGARERFRDHPVRTLTDPIVLERGTPTLPGTYVSCVTDGEPSPVWDPSRANAERLGWTFRAVESTHDVALENPAGIAALLSEIAADA
jgi:pimeloyl-ACP methyl ester carboxylesterase